MLKTTFSLLLFIVTAKSEAQAIQERTIESSGNIMVITTMDTLASKSKFCAVEGVIYNQDSVNYYAMKLYFDAPKLLHLSNQDSISFHFSDGENFKESIYIEDKKIEKGERLRVLIATPEFVLEELYRNPVKSITLESGTYTYTLKVEDIHSDSFQALAEYMMNLNVFDENGIKWSELSKMKFPEN